VSIWSCASNESAWRGYEYYEQGKVSSYEKLDDGIYRSWAPARTSECYDRVGGTKKAILVD